VEKSTSLTAIFPVAALLSSFSSPKDLLLFVALAFIFHVFSPKIACQVQKPPKPLQTNTIRMAF
jgi:hypothetical protein